MGRYCFVYVLVCVDGTFYVGITANLTLRLAQHQMGHDLAAYTYRRRPVRLVWCERFPSLGEALARERQLKGWSRAKKEALITGDVDLVHEIVATERRRRERSSHR
jgi:predicted GIY-YIG superfamily endonuclease